MTSPSQTQSAFEERERERERERLFEGIMIDHEQSSEFIGTRQLDGEACLSFSRIVREKQRFFYTKGEFCVFFFGSPS